MFTDYDVVTGTEAGDLMFFGSLGHLLCGVSSSKVDSAMENNGTARVLLSLAGRMTECPNKETLQILANKVTKGSY